MKVNAGTNRSNDILCENNGRRKAELGHGYTVLIDQFTQCDKTEISLIVLLTYAELINHFDAGKTDTNSSTWKFHSESFITEFGWY